MGVPIAQGVAMEEGSVKKARILEDRGFVTALTQDDCAIDGDLTGISHGHRVLYTHHTR